MTSCSWRGLIITLLMIALPLAGHAAIVMPVFTAGGHMLSQPAGQKVPRAAPAAAATVHSTAGIVQSAVAEDAASCSLPCQMDQDDRCDMAHGAASCLVAIAPAPSLVPPRGLSLAPAVPGEFDPSSYIPPLLERPPAFTLLLS